MPGERTRGANQIPVDAQPGALVPPWRQATGGGVSDTSPFPALSLWFVQRFQQVPPQTAGGWRWRTGAGRWRRPTNLHGPGRRAASREVLLLRAFAACCGRRRRLALPVTTTALTVAEEVCDRVLGWWLQSFPGSPASVTCACTCARWRASVCARAHKGHSLFPCALAVFCWCRC